MQQYITTRWELISTANDSCISAKNVRSCTKGEGGKTYSFRMKQSGQSRSLAASETRSNAKKRRTDSRVAKIDVESKKNSARWGRGKGGGNKPIVGFSFSKKKIKLRKDCQRNSNRKNAELTNEKREMANTKPANPRTSQQQREKKKKRAREKRDISQGYDGGTSVPARNGGARKQTSVKFRRVIALWKSTKCHSKNSTYFQPRVGE